MFNYFHLYHVTFREITGLGGMGPLVMMPVELYVTRRAHELSLV